MNKNTGNKNKGNQNTGKKSTSNINIKLAEAIVAEANLAPSVHNTQPTRWTIDGNALILSLDKNRLLQVGDPTARDARLSMGAALHGTSIAANRNGLGVVGIESHNAKVRIEFCKDAVTVWDKAVIDRRLTWRHLSLIHI